MNEDILKSIDILSIECDYWFVRTDGGDYFNTFFENKFIGINWNEISFSDLNNPPVETKSKISQIYKLNESSRKGKSKATEIYNKLMRFKNLKKDDVIVIPSENSNHLAFGVIADNKAYEDLEESMNCPYIKRRKVKWMTASPKPFSEVDNIFYKIRKSRHSISNVNEYADYIDSEMYNIYKKSDKSHFVINVNQQGAINWHELASVLLEMHELMSEVNKVFELNENVKDGSIQITLQSPGLFNLGQKGISLILLATALGASSCGKVKGNLSEEHKTKLEKFEKDNSQRLDTLQQRLDTLVVHL